MSEGEKIENVDCALQDEKTPSLYAFPFNESNHVLLGWQLEKRLNVSRL